MKFTVPTNSLLLRAAFVGEEDSLGELQISVNGKIVATIKEKDVPNGLNQYLVVFPDQAGETNATIRFELIPLIESPLC